MNSKPSMITHRLSHITRYALYALLIFTPLARASVQPWAITVIHMVTLIALTSFLLEKTMAWDWKWIKTPLDKPIVCLLFLCFLSSLFSLHRITSFWSMILLINYLTIFYLTIHTFRTRSQLRRLIALIIAIAAFLSIFGLFKYIGTNPFPWWEYTDIPQKSFRLSSTFGNPDHLAGFMEMALPLLLGLFLLGYRRKVNALWGYLTCLLLAALLLSLSRGSWLGAATGLLFMAGCLLFDRYFESKRLIFWIMAGTVAVILIVLSTTPVVERIVVTTERDPETNLSSRILGWKGTVEMINAYPFTGTGPGTYAFLFTQYQPPGLSKHRTKAHNDYLQFIAEIGLPIVLVMAWMIIALYRKGFNKLRNRSRLARGTTLGAMSGILAILIHSFFDFNLQIPSNAILFSILAAIVAAPLPITDNQ